MPFEGPEPTETTLPPRLDPEKHKVASKGDRAGQREREKIARKEKREEVLDRLEWDEDFRNKHLDRWLKDVSFDDKVIDPETGKEYLVFDFAALEKIFAITPRYNNVSVPRGELFRLMQDRYSSQKYVTPEQVAVGDFEAKKLFFWPETYEEVIDETNIKNARFHKLPSDLIKGISKRTPREIQDEYGETKQVSDLESEFALKLSHPDYGDGFRDRKGNFIIRDKQTREYEKLTYKHLEAYGFTAKVFNSEERGETTRSVWEGMKERLPNLYEEGVIKDGDIAEMMRRVSEDFKSTQKDIISVGNAVFNGVVHHIGREYSPRQRPGIKAKSVSFKRALILDEEGMVEGYFNTFQKEDPEVKFNNSEYTGNIGKRDANPKRIDFESIIGPRREDGSDAESLSDYDGRVESTKRGITQFYTQVLPGIEGADDIIDRSGTGEQKGLSDVAYWLDKNGKTGELHSFAQSFGSVGLRSFVQLGTKESVAEHIIDFSNENPEVSKQLFTIYGELLDYANTAEEEVRRNTECSTDDCESYTEKVRSNILSQAEKLLLGSIETGDTDQVAEKLNEFSADARMYVATLQSIGVEKMLEHPLEEIPAAELTEEDKEQMLQLLQENYSRLYPEDTDAEFREKIYASLQTAFSQDNTSFYVLRDGDNIVSFNRFDRYEQDSKQKVYFGSFNADKTYYGLGGIMMENTLLKELENCDVMQAHCDPTNDISMKYIESGFVAKETETLAGKFSFEIWRTKDISGKLETKQKDVPTLLELVDSNEAGSNYFVREVEDNDSFHELDEGLGYLLTRYFEAGDKRYVAFEIPPKEIWEALS